MLLLYQWFETPVDAELFEHMAKECPQFQEVKIICSLGPVLSSVAEPVKPTLFEELKPNLSLDFVKPPLRHIFYVFSVTVIVHFKVAK